MRVQRIAPPYGGRVTVAAAAGWALLWNVVLGGAIGVATACAFAVAGFGSENRLAAFVVVLGYGVGIGTTLGLAAGVVHALARLPLALARGSVPRGIVRAQATVVSAVNVLLLYALLDFDLTRLALIPFGAYVGLTPWVAARRP